MAFGGGQDKMLDQIFNLKFTSKQLVRNSKKCEKEEKEEKAKARADAVRTASRVGTPPAEPRARR